MSCSKPLSDTAAMEQQHIAAMEEQILAGFNALPGPAQIQAELVEETQAELVEDTQVSFF